MTGFGWWLLQHSLGATVLALLATALAKGLRRRPALLHALWLLVLLKLTLPPLLWWPWSISVPAIGWDAPVISAETADIPHPSHHRARGDGREPFALLGPVDAALDAPELSRLPTELAELEPNPSRAHSFWTMVGMLALAVWMVGSFVVAVYQAKKIVRFARRSPRHASTCRAFGTGAPGRSGFGGASPADCRSARFGVALYLVLGMGAPALAPSFTNVTRAIPRDYRS